MKSKPIWGTSVKLFEVWLHARSAYYEPEKVIFNEKTCEHFERIVTELDYGYVAEFEKYIVCSFRGTDSDEIGINSIPVIRRWIRNLNIRPLVDDGSWGKGTIHRGAYQMWKSLKKEFYAAFNKIQGFAKPIVCTGHSAGAWCAMLCARDMVKNNRIKHVNCVCFGMPNLFTRKGLLEYYHLPIGTAIIVNGRDGAHRFPRSLCKPLPAIWYDEPKIKLYVSSVIDHLPREYTYAIDIDTMVNLT